jgi:phosphoribosylaminoimidazole-succinocarboxamide synthase
MFNYEIVVRHKADGSYCERYPETPKGYVFPEPIVEFFLKTKGKNFKGKPLVCDDPYMTFDKSAGTISLYDAHRPMKDQLEPFLVLEAIEVFVVDNEWKYFAKMRKIAVDTFHIVRQCFAKLGYDYIDFKVECGLTAYFRVVIADLIDGDSGRIQDPDGIYIDKQYYRDGGDLENMMKKFQLIAELTRQF